VRSEKKPRAADIYLIFQSETQALQPGSVEGWSDNDLANAKCRPIFDGSIDARRARWPAIFFGKKKLLGLLKLEGQRELLYENSQTPLVLPREKIERSFCGCSTPSTRLHDLA
jgi:hypothetical protein